MELRSRSKVRPKFHLARLDSTRHVRLSRASRDERVERVEPCCSNMADQEQAIVLAWYKFSRFYALAYTNPICFVKKNYVYSNKLVSKIVTKIKQVCYKKNVNEQHGLRRGWKNEPLAVKRMKVTGQFADKLRAHEPTPPVYVRCLGCHDVT